MTPKQIRFVNEYLIDLNATQAAIRAGYSAPNAGKIAFQLLEKTRIRLAIKRAMKDRENRTKLNADQVLRELKNIGFSNILDGVSFLKGNPTIPRGKLSGVKEIKVWFNRYGAGYRIVLLNKVQALFLIGAHLGMWKKGEVLEHEERGAALVEIMEKIKKIQGRD